MNVAKHKLPAVGRLISQVQSPNPVPPEKKQHDRPPEILVTHPEAGMPGAAKVGVSSSNMEWEWEWSRLTRVSMR
jgi:hypothetical protein